MREQREPREGRGRSGGRSGRESDRPRDDFGRGSGHGRHGGPGGRGRGGRGFLRDDTGIAPDISEEVSGWLAGRLPTDWFTAAPEVTSDRDETTIVGPLAAPELPADASDEQRAASWAGRIKAFRESTRDARIEIAGELEQRTNRRVAWGASCGEDREIFTSASVPVMTRLRQPERIVLDTLVESGVARSRSEALAWCVGLVGQNTDEWLGNLRSAMEQVRKLREQGPEA